VSVTIGLLDQDRLLSGDESRSANLANRNFVHVMLELGYQIIPADGLVGELDPAELKARCLLYTNLAPDGLELPTIEEQGGRFIEVGQRPGYLKATADRLYELAELALSEGCQLAYA
jgi:hypothetical protein